MTDSKRSPIGTVGNIHAAFTALRQSQVEHDQAMAEQVRVHYTRDTPDSQPPPEDNAR